LVAGGRSVGLHATGLLGYHEVVDVAFLGYHEVVEDVFARGSVDETAAFCGAFGPLGCQRAMVSPA